MIHIHDEDLKYFKISDFACPCCGLNLVDAQLMLLIDNLRERLGRPLVISSATRCPKHNEEVGGAGLSTHMEGKAIDLAYRNNAQQFELIRVIIEQGHFKRIGTYSDKKCVHIDTARNDDRPCFWTV